MGDRVTGLGEFLEIGRLFALGSFLKITKMDKLHTCNFFSYRKSYLHIYFVKNGMGYNLGDFGTNSSGHPGVGQVVLGLPFLRKKLCIKYDKNVLGYVLGEFFRKLIRSP
jgi:hypothetical protein